MNFISFPKIGQYNSTIHGIITNERFVKMDESGRPVFDGNKKLEKIVFEGTVKLHGTNAAICIKNNEYWLQSRENILTPIKDNCGFAAHFLGSEKKEKITQIINRLREVYNIDKEKTIAIFGEWVGPGVQKNVAISKIPAKSLFIFAIRVVSNMNEQNKYEYDQWLPIDNIRDYSINLYNIKDYLTYSLEIDLNNPGIVVSYLQELVNSVEKECPVAKSFDILGLGEGIVWTTNYKNVRHTFKTKGKEHAVTVHKDGKTVHIDTEKINNIKEFVDYAVTNARLNQGIEKIYGKGLLDKKKLGDFIKWVINDVITEEIDVLSKNGLTSREVQGQIANKARDFFNLLLNRYDATKKWADAFEDSANNTEVHQFERDAFLSMSEDLKRQLEEKKWNS